MKKIKGLLILDRVQVENANAIAGMTWGFPAVSAFLGFVHALERQYRAKSDTVPLKLLGCGIVCHEHQTHAYQAESYTDHYFALTRNPLNEKGQSASFVEEGRMHMTVSLVIPVEGNMMRASGQDVAAVFKKLVAPMRMAGGVISKINRVRLVGFNPQSAEASGTVKSEMRKLLPGFALVSRQDELAKHQQTRRETPGPLAAYGCEEADLQAWLEFSSLSSSARPSEKDDVEAEWDWDERPGSGWLRPIAIGYRALSPLYAPGEVKNTRDRQTPVRFVESLYSLGEWLSPHRIKTIEQLYWYQSMSEDQTRYLCNNDYDKPPVAELAEQ